MIMYGKDVAAAIKLELAARIQKYRGVEPSPHLAIVRMGQRSDDISYEAALLRNCREIGMKASVIELPVEADTGEVLSIVGRLNADRSVHGILVFQPLPPHIDAAAVSKALLKEKDADSMNPYNLRRLMVNDPRGIPPCTPEAVIRILKHYGCALAGKHVVIVNRSTVLGKPLSMMLLAEDATVTLCHSKTQRLAELTAQADIVVTGAGKPRMFGPDYFSRHSIVVDVGINFDGQGMCGDVDFAAVSPQVQAITPVPGGVGAVTSAVLLSHVLPYALRQQRRI